MSRDKESEKLVKITKKMAEQGLEMPKHDSTLFQMIIDNVTDLIWAKNMDDQFIFCNQSICDQLLMARSKAEVIGKTDVFFADRERQSGYDHTFGEICVNSDQIVKNTKQPGRFIEEGRVRGEYLILDVHKAPFFDKNGKMIGTVGCGRDITGQKDTESQLRRSREQFISVLDNLTSAVYVVDIETCELLFINRTMAGYYGKSPELFVGKTCWKVLFKNRKSPCKNCKNSRLLDKAGRPLGVMESEHNNKWLNRIFEISDQVIKWSDGRLVKLTIATDITEKKQAAVALAESEKKFRTLFNGIDDAIFVHRLVNDGFSNFIEVNDVACTRYGYTRDEFKKISPHDLHTKKVREDLSKDSAPQPGLIKYGQIVSEWEHVKKNGDVFPVEISSTLFDFRGEQMILSTARDITDRKIRQKERDEAIKFTAEQEKYALVGQVAGKMAHDFNNILGAIMGHAEISMLDCQEESTLSSLNIILEQTLRGKSLTQNLVAFAKDQEPKEEYFNVNSKIDLVINLLQKDLDETTVVREYKPGLPDVLADPGMIEHILVNLVQNAVHAMSLVKNPRLIIKTFIEDDRIFIKIIDIGCGIPQKYQADIFMPSFTLKGSRDVTCAYRQGIKGTGYGMANVKKYIEKHKGMISFESRVNEGSTFTLAIPVIEKQLTTKEKTLISKKKVATHKNILLVEDEPAISAVQQKILNHDPFHHKVALATTAQEAMELFDQGDFDLISLDYLLPGNLTGLDVYKYVRKKNKTIPIIFVSGNIGFLESMKEISATDRFMDHISKPCGNIVYANTINKWLE